MMAARDTQKIICLIPPHYDFLCATVIDGLQQLDCNLRCSERTNNTTTGEFSGPDDLLPLCRDCDLIFLFSNTGYADRKKFVIVNNLAHKTVYIDGSDRHYSLEDPEAFQTFLLSFKRELPPLRSLLGADAATRSFLEFLRRLKNYLRYRRRVPPLPFAAERAYLESCTESTVRDIPVSCTLVPKSADSERARINECVTNLNIPGACVGRVSHGHFAMDSRDECKSDYFKVLARSKISISYPGLGFDTGRFWEILASKALLFSPPLQIRMPHPFIEFKHFIPFNNLVQLKSRLLYYLNRNAERECIVDAGYRHLLRYHTSKQRAKYLLDIVLPRVRGK